MNDVVLIVGAGPVGLTLALALKRQGVNIRLVDKAPSPSDKSKALVLWPRTLELLDIQGCVAPFLAAGEKATGVRIIADGKLLVHLQLDLAPSIYQFALMLPQSDTEGLLTEQLNGLGVHVERQVELGTFIDDGRGVTATLTHPGGREESLRASYLVGCDGAHSTVRHRLASQFEGDTLPSDWILADVELEGELPRNEIAIHWSAEGVLVLFPIKGDRFRVIADVGATSDPDPSLEDVQRVTDERGPQGLRVHDPVWINRFRINERKVVEYRKGRVFLAGDAAHVHSPAGGQGMNTGMQDALNLAWKLSLVWRNRASTTLLASYSPERSAIGKTVLRNAGNLTKIAILRNPLLQELRSLAIGTLGKIGALRQRMVNQLAEVDLDYRESPLSTTPSGASRHPAAGERAPDMSLSTSAGPTRLHEFLSRGQFAVVSIGGDAIQLPASVHPIASTAHTDSAPGYEAGHVYLIRPDAYVMMSTPRADPNPIAMALERIRTV